MPENNYFGADLVRRREIAENKIRAEHRAEVHDKARLIGARRKNIAEELGRFDDSDIQQKLQREHQERLAIKQARLDAETAAGNETISDGSRAETTTRSQKPPFAEPEQGLFKKFWGFIKRGW